MSIIWRPHRGGLDAAMREAKEFNDIEEMKDYLVNLFRTTLEREDIVIDERVSDDDRIGWKNVHMVCAKKLWGEDYMYMYGCPQCIGWCGEVQGGNQNGI